MRKISLAVFILYSGLCSAQQNLPPYLLKNASNITAKSKASNEKSNFFGGKLDSGLNNYSPRFTFYGIGNLSSESLEKLNGGGKIAFLFNTSDPIRFMPKSYFVSFNKNATNNDSLLPSTLVFPEVGNHSFLITSFWDLKQRSNCDIIDQNTQRHRAFYLEFALKSVKITSKDANLKNEERSFNILHYSAGYKYTFDLSRKIDSTQYNSSFGTTFFVSYTNIPKDDSNDFINITNQSVFHNSFFTAGIKFSLSINNFQIFADLRHTLTKKSELPMKELRGFNSNIGVLFSSEIFKL